MATRKIRVTMSSTKVDDVGALVDIDFNNENLDVDVDVDATNGESTLVKEYTVDVTHGTYDLAFTFKNDVGASDPNIDRNLYIEQLEIANDGVNYEPFQITNANSNIYGLSENYKWERLPNPDFDPNGVFGYNGDYLPENHINLYNNSYDASVERTDRAGWAEINAGPGSNPLFAYTFNNDAVVLFTTDRKTVSIVFTD